MSVVRHLAKVGCSDPNERHSKEQSSRTFTSSPHVAYCNSHRPGKGWHEVRVLIFRKQFGLSKPCHPFSTCHRFTTARSQLYVHSSNTPALSHRHERLERIVLRWNLPNEIRSNNGELREDIVPYFGDLAEEEEREDAC